MKHDRQEFIATLIVSVAFFAIFILVKVALSP
jgi:hypothetical protein